MHILRLQSYENYVGKCVIMSACVRTNNASVSLLLWSDYSAQISGKVADICF